MKIGSGTWCLSKEPSATMRERGASFLILIQNNFLESRIKPVCFPQLMSERDFTPTPSVLVYTSFIVLYKLAK
jgi:hypothetical protein